MDTTKRLLGALSAEIARTEELLGRARQEADRAREELTDARLRLLIAETPIADLHHQRAASAFSGRSAVVGRLEILLKALRHEESGRIPPKPAGAPVRRTA